MQRHRQQLEGFLGRYGLAICCLILPLVPINWPAWKITPSLVTGVISEYRPYVPIMTPEKTRMNYRAYHSDGSTILQSRFLAGREPLAITSSFSSTICIAILILSSTIILNHLSIATCCASAALYGLLGYAIAYSDIGLGPSALARSILFDRLIDAADTFEPLRQLALPGGTSKHVAALVRLNIFAGGFSVLMLTLCLFALSIRPLDKYLDYTGLRRRLWLIRCALGLASAILVTAVVGTRVMFDWTLGLVEESQAVALKPLADAVVLDVGGGSTLVTILGFGPAVVSYLLDVRRFRASRNIARPHNIPEATDKEKMSVADDGLSFAPLSTIAGGIAVCAPLLTPPVLDIFKAVLNRIQN